MARRAHTAGMDGGGTTRELRATEIAYLAGGEWLAVRAGLIMLYRRGRLETDERGRINRTGPAPRDAEPLERALYNALLGWTGPKEITNRPRVREALAELRGALRGRRQVRPPWVRLCVPAALLAVPAWAVARLGAPPLVAMPVILAGVAAALWFVPRRTAAGVRRLQRLRAGERDLVEVVNAGPRAGANLSPERAGLAVALFGNAALLAVDPVLATRGGLIDGGRWTRESREQSTSYGQWTAEAMGHLGNETTN
ncbi:hypothetical protein GCM10022255_078700 [Dactylosporangium darangshiense]|uniref:TIGR04222 domain-containing membrane protein n=1 Tax=Dactylosporangium darangshiense TaxID=579108 RepID=A0ABP8DKL2_9ACTN